MDGVCLSKGIVSLSLAIVAKTSFCAVIISKQSFCQVTLETSIGKTQNERPFFSHAALAPQPNAVDVYTELPSYPIKQVAHPIKFSVSRHKPTGAAPELGRADTEAVLVELGLSAQELAALTTSGGSSE